MKFRIFLYNFILISSLFSLVNATYQKRYLLYDVNYGEGFNLKRDVYIRMANLLRFLNKQDKLSNWTLVVPPFGRIYHWNSPDITAAPWSIFFDLDKLNLFVPVIDFEEFQRISTRPGGGPLIDDVFYLKNLPFKNGDSWSFKIQEDYKSEDYDSPYRQESDGTFSGWFFGLENVRAKRFKHLGIMAEAVELKEFLLNEKLENSRAIMIDRAECLIHGTYSEWSPEFWTGRRSLVFSQTLRKMGDDFRRQYLNSNDEEDRTTPPPNNDWRIHPWPQAPALGGPYLAVHLRRGDMARVPGRVASLKYAIEQVDKLAKTHSLTNVFIASDATDAEYESIREDLVSRDLKVFRQKFTRSQLDQYTPGGEAIVDQWIAMHAKIFAGTRESTFSFRIVEEREIMGFPFVASHHVICADDMPNCDRFNRWEIKLEPEFTIRSENGGGSKTIRREDEL